MVVMVAMQSPPDWTAKGLCSGPDGRDRDFFGAGREDWAECKEVCRRCPMRLECLDYALETKQTHGVWGGADQRELREALGLSAAGDTYLWPREVRCPACRSQQVVRDEERPGRGRGWARADVHCTMCGAEWEREEETERAHDKREKERLRRERAVAREQRRSS